jgi:thioredoxin-related protein
MIRLPRPAMAALALLALLTAFAAAADKAAPPPGWLARYAEALKASKESGRPILAAFTASDWSPNCVKQEQEVFATEAFKKWAAENVVLLVLDFPDRKPQDAAIKAQNKDLKARFKIATFPTLVFLSTAGEEIGRLDGYAPGTGVEKWLEKANPILAGKK